MDRKLKVSDIKKCAHCGTEFYKNAKHSITQWENSRFCSVGCNSRYHGALKRRCIFDRVREKQIISLDGSCWGWSGAMDNHGYPIISNRIRSNKSPEKAHRVSYEMHKGAIPDGAVIMHKCDNPVCTNPDHLEAGTQKQNMMDCSRKGRLNPNSLKNLVSGSKGYLGAAVDKNKVSHVK